MPRAERPCLPRDLTRAWQTALEESKGETSFSRVLDLWSRGSYATDDDEDLFNSPYYALLLDETYDKGSLSVNILEDTDADKVKHLIPIAEGLGYKVGFAALTYIEEGNDDVSMCDTNGTYRISHLVHHDGTEMFKGSKRQVEINWFRVLPEEHFEDGPDRRDRDDSDYDDDIDMGKGLRYKFRFHYTVVILYHQRNEKDVAFKLEFGKEWGMSRLTASSDSPTEDDRALVKELLEGFEDWYGDSWADHSLDPVSQETIKLLMDATARWKEESLWLQSVAKAWFYYPLIGKQRIRNALAAFPFESMKATVEQVIKRCTGLTKQRRLARLVTKQYAGNADAKSWFNAQWSKCLVTYKAGLETDLSLLVETGKKGKLGVLERSVIPNISKRTGKFWFFMKLAGLFEERRDEISRIEQKSTSTIDSVISSCLKAAAKQYTDGEDDDYEYDDEDEEVKEKAEPLPSMSDALATALKWKNADLWSAVVSKNRYDLTASVNKRLQESTKDIIIQGLTAFQFDAIKPCLQSVCYSCETRESRMEIVDLVGQHGGGSDGATEWIATESGRRHVVPKIIGRKRPAGSMS
ncbi:hypothetical protein BKA70DRAFT_1401592 [Coprinopsis sp. MPI-PUGE-AT-0042]|nr:hypothetical protein BKA70DRAFT_1401592 [Coprinopsis sp. MPI-PUGE-AT-0042]